jgi:hypothetical protein
MMVRAITDSEWLMAFRKRLLDYRRDVLKTTHYTWHDSLEFDVFMSPEDYCDLADAVRGHESYDLALNRKDLMMSSIGVKAEHDGRTMPPEFERLFLKGSDDERD